MDNDKKKTKNINGVGSLKHIAMHAFFSKWGIKRNGASTESEKIFEKMIGRLQIIQFVHTIHTFVCYSLILNF